MAIDTQQQEKEPSHLAQWIPILRWLPTYDRSWLRGDVIAGLTLWGLVTPEAMAYSGIAGMPPQAGLYTLLISLLVYAMLGTARHLNVGPTSASAALLASTVATVMAGAALAPSDQPSLYHEYALALVIVVGLLFIFASLAKLGFITQFLPKPVMDGFVLGLAIFIAIGQLNKLFGVTKVDGNTVEKLLHLIRELPQTNPATLAIGISALATLFLLPRLSKKLPAGLVVLFGFILISTLFNLSGRFGVEVVGRLPQGLPAPTFPIIPIAGWISLVLPAMGILLVVFSESLGIATEFAEKHGYEVDPDQELRAIGATNLLSGLFGGLITGGSMSSSAVKEAAGARTLVSNLAAWVAVVITVLFLTPLFTYLPEAVLGALIIHAVWHLITARKLQRVRMASPTEFWLGVAAMLGVLLIDVLPGMLIGMVAALLLVIARSSRPHIASLGQVPNEPGAYTDLGRHPENVATTGVLIVRPDAQLYYANAQYFRDSVKALVKQRMASGSDPHLHAVIIDADLQDSLDLTSSDILKGLIQELHATQLNVFAANVHAPVADFAQRTGLSNQFGADRRFSSVHAAVQYAQAHPTFAPIAETTPGEAASAAA
jgi:high affinity sulfate transporter 1